MSLMWRGGGGGQEVYHHKYIFRKPDTPPTHWLNRAICLECPDLSAEPSLTSFMAFVANIKTIILETSRNVWKASNNSQSYDFCAMFLDVFISLSSDWGLMILRLIGVYHPFRTSLGGSVWVTELHNLFLPVYENLSGSSKCFCYLLLAVHVST